MSIKSERMFVTTFSIPADKIPNGTVYIGEEGGESNFVAGYLSADEGVWVTEYGQDYFSDEGLGGDLRKE
ncbi:MAG: hypothetical protein K6F53_06410 [Lachnospiraceae bacterium]|nr:hypothetical protein [Lachnospiraceae bacterium]